MFDELTHVRSYNLQAVIAVIAVIKVRESQELRKATLVNAVHAKINLGSQALGVFYSDKDN